MTGTVAPVESAEPVSGLANREIALVDLLDRLLAGGVVLAGDLTVSLAGVDLIRISLRALITSITPVGPAEEEPS
ncbi:Gas vesicle protein [Pseudonocardia ammonioxydans]|uniref:Gas vesicle protein n=1 Tax=Pseudonocardia ammonioxydans TaxID=260086 RepID=A0A1I4TG47_PSUAM|nr:gas vesicle protein [Pseudonocardia ammonioxydans]SFM75659.1 Gas vesicle protein [Pseudonocardia ammonioxydans]